MFERLWSALKRTKLSWLLLVVPMFAFGKFKDIQLFAYKLSLVGVAVIIAHFIRSELFPYVDLQKEMRLSVKSIRHAARFLGVCILIGLLMYSIISGLTGGL
ncbi:MAG: hypothetical protein AB1488_05595 [Nitrospirota bacterium]